MELIVVGGFVRDFFLETQSKDVDFAIEASSYEAMKQWLLTYNGFVIDKEEPEYGRIKGAIPSHYLKWVPEAYRTLHGKVPVLIHGDFVICRADGNYTDGRHPDEIKPASLFEDLSRRDFTMNALAVRDSTGYVVDLFDGLRHLKHRELHTVGTPGERFSEDALRIMRYYRFQVTKDLKGSSDVAVELMWEAKKYAELLRMPIFHNRIREELMRMFRHDSMKAMKLLTERVPSDILDVIFKDAGIWLKPTSETR